MFGEKAHKYNFIYKNDIIVIFGKNDYRKYCLTLRLTFCKINLHFNVLQPLEQNIQSSCGSRRMISANLDDDVNDLGAAIIAANPSREAPIHVP